MKYNEKKKYNLSLDKDGIGYNGIKYIFKVNVFDVIDMSDSYLKAIAYIAVSDKFSVSDFLYQHVTHSFEDYFNILEESKNYALFEFAEKQNISDPLYKLTTLLYLTDNEKGLDTLNYVNALIKKGENISLLEKEYVKAFVKTLDELNFSDLREVFAAISYFDKFAVNDRDPKKAISDFIIGKADGLDNAYDWIVPFDMKIDWVNSSIQVVPQSQSDYIEQPGIDGSIVENTVYKNRLFSIVAYSNLGMTVYEKEMLKKEIARILDSTKSKTKKLTMQAADISFDVKYSGSAEVSEGPSFVRATIPFEASPYGYPLFEQEVFGTGLLINDGVKDVGCVNKILSGAVNPSFQMGSITYKFNGTVPADTTLFIDHEAYTCYFETVTGTRTNVYDKLEGDFQKIHKESTVAITAFGDTGDYLVTTLKECYLW